MSTSLVIVVGTRIVKTLRKVWPTAWRRRIENMDFIDGYAHNIIYYILKFNTFFDLVMGAFFDGGPSAVRQLKLAVPWPLLGLSKVQPQHPHSYQYQLSNGTRAVSPSQNIKGTLLPTRSEPLTWELVAKPTRSEARATPSEIRALSSALWDQFRDSIEKFLGKLDRLGSIFSVQSGKLDVLGFPAVLLDHGQHFGENGFELSFLGRKFVDQYLDAVMARSVFSLGQKISFRRIKHRIVSTRDHITVLPVTHEKFRRFQALRRKRQAAFNKLLFLDQRGIPSLRMFSPSGELESSAGVTISGEMSTWNRAIGSNAVSATANRSAGDLARETTTSTSVSDARVGVPRAFDPNKSTATKLPFRTNRKPLTNSLNAARSNLDNRGLVGFMKMPPHSAKVYQWSRLKSKRPLFARVVFPQYHGKQLFREEINQALNERFDRELLDIGNKRDYSSVREFVRALQNYSARKWPAQGVDRVSRAEGRAETPSLWTIQDAQDPWTESYELDLSEFESIGLLVTEQHQDGTVFHDLIFDRQPVSSFYISDRLGGFVHIEWHGNLSAESTAYDSRIISRFRETAAFVQGWSSIGDQVQLVFSLDRETFEQEKISSITFRKVPRRVIKRLRREWAGGKRTFTLKLDEIKEIFKERPRRSSRMRIHRATPQQLRSLENRFWKKEPMEDLTLDHILGLLERIEKKQKAGNLRTAVINVMPKDATGKKVLAGDGVWADKDRMKQQIRQFQRGLVDEALVWQEGSDFVAMRQEFEEIGPGLTEFLGRGSNSPGIKWQFSMQLQAEGLIRITKAPKGHATLFRPRSEVRSKKKFLRLRAEFKSQYYYETKKGDGFYLVPIEEINQDLAKHGLVDQLFKSQLPLGDYYFAFRALPWQTRLIIKIASVDLPHKIEGVQLKATVNGAIDRIRELRPGEQLSSVTVMEIYPLTADSWDEVRGLAVPAAEIFGQHGVLQSIKAYGPNKISRVLGKTTHMPSLATNAYQVDEFRIYYRSEARAGKIVAIDRGNPEPLRQIVEIWNRYDLPGLYMDELKRLLDRDENGLSRAVIDRGKVLGFIVARVKAIWEEGGGIQQIVYVNRFAVRRGFQDQGIGKRLIRSLAAASQSLNLKEIHLDALATHLDTIARYKTMGFKEVRKHIAGPEGYEYVEMKLALGGNDRSEARAVSKNTLAPLVKRVLEAYSVAAFVHLRKQTLALELENQVSEEIRREFLEAVLSALGVEVANRQMLQVLEADRVDPLSSEDQYILGISQESPNAHRFGVGFVQAGASFNESNIREAQALLETQAHRHKVLVVVLPPEKSPEEVETLRAQAAEFTNRLILVPSVGGMTSDHAYTNTVQAILSGARREFSSLHHNSAFLDRLQSMACKLSKEAGLADIARLGSNLHNYATVFGTVDSSSFRDDVSLMSEVNLRLVDHAKSEFLAAAFITLETSGIRSQSGTIADALRKQLPDTTIDTLHFSDPASRVARFIANRTYLDAISHLRQVLETVSSAA